MAPHEVSRRSFIQTAAAATVGFSAIGAPAIQAQGANDKIVLAVMGVNGRGSQLARLLAGMPNTEVGYIVDVDDKAIAKGLAAVAKGGQTRAPKTSKDIRKVLEDKASTGSWSRPRTTGTRRPPSWAAPPARTCTWRSRVATTRARANCWSLPPAATTASSRWAASGVRGRTSRSMTKQLREGTLIGRVYFARGWYANTRASIGVGKAAPVPAGLDYELWQGPAPRREYKDNLIHYNWHWFWNWGTSEACNNGTHEIDVMRWAMGVTYPTKVESGGGRYHFKDDWECADTQTASFEFEGNKSFIWEGRSCNGFLTEGLARGITFHGENGSVLVDDDSYTVFDLKGKTVKKVGGGPAEQSTTNTTGPGDRLDSVHLVNFLDSVRSRKAPNAEIEEGHRSVLLCHLANVAYRVGHTLRTDPKNGHILDDAKAQALWGRTYEPGWEPEGAKGTL